MKTRLSRLNQAGFSLMEVLIAGSVSIIVAFGVSHLMQLSAKSSTSIRALTDFNSLVAQVQSVINFPQTCNLAMSNQPFTPPAAAGPLSPPQNLLAIKTGGATGTLVVPAPVTAYGSTLEITKLQWVEATPLGGNQYLAKFLLEAKKIVTGNAVGSQYVNHTFDLVISVTGGLITGCHGSSGSIELWKKVAVGDDIYYTNGNVGIGTNAPVSALDVRGGSSGLAYPTMGTSKGGIHLAPASSTPGHSNAITFGANDASLDNANAGIYVQSAGAYGTKMHLATTDSYAIGAKSRMTIDAVGNVGIGNIAPVAKLEVSGTIRPAPAVPNTGCGTLLGAQAYDSVTGAPLYCSNAGQWTPIGGDFSALKAPNGYQKLPSGVIIQWGSVNALAGAQSNIIAFPIAFPNAAFTVVASMNENQFRNYNLRYYVSDWTRFNFQIWNLGVTQGVSWIAIGH